MEIIKLLYVKNLEKEVYDKVLDTLMSTRGRPKKEEVFINKIEDEILEQIDVEEIVDQAYANLKRDKKDRQKRKKEFAS